MQALLWAWTHALPVRLQRPEGDAARLPSMAPGALLAPPKPALLQPLVMCPAAEEAVDTGISSGKAASGAADVALVGRAQQVTWAADNVCITGSAAEFQQMHAAASSLYMRSAMIALIVASLMLSLLLVFVKHVQ